MIRATQKKPQVLTHCTRFVLHRLLAHACSAEVRTNCSLRANDGGAALRGMPSVLRVELEPRLCEEVVALLRTPRAILVRQRLLCTRPGLQLLQKGVKQLPGGHDLVTADEILLTTTQGLQDQ